MNVIDLLLIAIREAKLPAPVYRTARELLDRTGANGYARLSYDEAMAIVQTDKPETLRGHLAQLQAKGLITYRRDDADVHVMWEGIKQTERETPEVLARSEVAARARSRDELLMRERAAARCQDVYFIRNTHNGNVKIGITANVSRRLKQLQGNYDPGALIVVGVISQGGIDVERQLHERFAQYRLHGEWFEWNEEIEAAIP